MIPGGSFLDSVISITLLLLRVFHLERVIYSLGPRLTTGKDACGAAEQEKKCDLAKVLAFIDKEEASSKSKA